MGFPVQRSPSIEEHKLTVLHLPLLMEKFFNKDADIFPSLQDHKECRRSPSSQKGSSKDCSRMKKVITQALAAVIQDESLIVRQIRLVDVTESRAARNAANAVVADQSNTCIHLHHPPEQSMHLNYGDHLAYRSGHIFTCTRYQLIRSLTLGPHHPSSLSQCRTRMRGAFPDFSLMMLYRITRAPSDRCEGYKYVVHGRSSHMSVLALR
jgi:hypothetical protein